MKVIFMGTPAFAVPIVEEISKVHDVVLVVTQPDVYNYKKKTITASEVKRWAVSKGIEVFQPEKIRNDFQKIIDTKADIIVTAAYGQIVSEEVLNHPRLKAINVHGSLLPKYRGGAPIQRALINGESKTGITIMYMAKKMDAGDILVQKEIPILDSDNQDTIFNKLSILGSEMINQTIDDLDKGLIKPLVQDEEKVTYAYNLTKEDEHINFNKEAREVFNQIRGLNSNPTGYIIFDNLNVKVYNSRVSDKTHQTDVGKIISISKDSFEVSCGGGTVISILEIQLPSKKKMSVRDFINGQGKKMLVIGKEIK